MEGTALRPGAATPTAGLWIYVFGERNGRDIKIGSTKRATIGRRLMEVDRDQMDSRSYVLLAGVRGSAIDEKSIHRYFERHRLARGSRQEYYEAHPDVTEYVNWLRRQYWTTFDPEATPEDAPLVAADRWLPNPGRRIPHPEVDPSQLVQPWAALDGPTAGTTWDWMVTTAEGVNDYFTPAELVSAARDAMGGIDLDAASHWLANRVHRIPDWFDISRSAFDNDWHGNVWLNPPYGNNKPWFEAAMRHLDAGRVRQLCWLSPMWVFITGIARPAMRKSSAAIILSPTPSFWGNKEGRTGTNDPHGIVYWGSQPERFCKAFTDYGIPVRVAWEFLA